MIVPFKGKLHLKIDNPFEFIIEREFDIVGVEPILRIRPGRTAKEDKVLIWLLYYVRGWHTMLAKGPNNRLVVDTSHRYNTDLPEE